VADGKLIAMSARGELLIAPVSAEKFAPLTKAQVLGGKCWTTPVLANGFIYCRNAAGEVVCLKVKE
jgi:outer membrane protein assembly factor BamB